VAFLPQISLSIVQSSVRLSVCSTESIIKLRLEPKSDLAYKLLKDICVAFLGLSDHSS